MVSFQDMQVDEKTVIPTESFEEVSGGVGLPAVVDSLKMESIGLEREVSTDWFETNSKEEVENNKVPGFPTSKVTSFSEDDKDLTSDKSTGHRSVTSAARGLAASIRQSRITPEYPSVWTRLPNTSFGISMGLIGQAIMWKVASSASFISQNVNAEIVSASFWFAGLLVASFLSAAYSFKIFRYFPLVKDEWKDPSRVHFFNMPHLIMIMLTISVPDTSPNIAGDGLAVRVLWGIGFVIQVLFTQLIYESWLFSDTHNISFAQPQFLLSTVGWFFLATLGSMAKIEQKWGLAIPSFCFGLGFIFYIMVIIAVFNGTHMTPKARGSPALFLLIAPPSVGVVAWDLIEAEPGKFSLFSQALLGWCLGIFLLLFKIGPQITKRPPSLGSYWAYVFPMSALATATIRYAWIVKTRSAEVMSLIFVALAIFALFVVFCRMCIHALEVLLGTAEWDDPLLSRERLQAVRAVNFPEVLSSQETA
jgi:tellurite resistance protein TehA-like permease